MSRATYRDGRVCVRKRPVHCKKIQALGGPVTDKALEEIVFRAAHGVLQSLAPYPGVQRVINHVDI